MNWCKRWLALLASPTLIGLPSPADAQVFGQAPSPFAQDYRVDVAVPDAPAFEMLQVGQSSILRPNTLQKLAIAFSDFRDADGSFQVPGDFAVEFSPAILLAGDDLDRATYEQKKLLHNLRISLATATDSLGGGAPSQAAFGLRLTVVNEADMALDPAFISSQQVTPLTRQILIVYQAARDRQVQAGIAPTEPIVLTEDERETVDRLSEEIKARWTARHWNAESLEFAFGVRATGLDAAASDARVDRYGVFATYANGLGGWGQIILGGRAGAERDDAQSSFSQALSLGARLYLGSNRHKVFLEAQQSIQEGEDGELLLNGGAELRLTDWIWAVGAIGVDDVSSDEGSNSTLTFSLKSAFP